MQIKNLKFLLIAVLITLAACSNGSNKKNEQSKTLQEKDNQINNKDKIELVASEKEELPDTFTDTRDGHVYKIVKIGSQLWLAENLAYKLKSNEAILSKHGEPISDLGNYWIYDEKEENVKKYGYLYNYKAAQKAVPEGWHLPTKAELETLLNHYGEEPYKALTADKGGLSIVFSGWYFGESAYVQEGEGVGFWSATKDDKDKEKALVLEIGKFDETSGYINISSRYMSDVGAAVRLIKNETNAANTSNN